MASFIRYPGGKKKFLKVIHERIRMNNDGFVEYREPFFGGGSVGLSLLGEGFRTFWVNDKDVGVCSMWRAVVDYPEELKERVRSFKPSVTDYDTFKEFLLGELAPGTKEEIVDVGFKKIAIHQISYSGLGTKSGGPLGGRKQNENSKYPIDCRWSPDYICKKIDKLHGEFAKLDSFSVTSLDFTDLIRDTSRNALIYLDPPYYDKGGELYQCAFTHEDHVRLADALRETPHRWVLSYDDCEEIRELYAWADIEVIDATYSINTIQKKQELLIYPKNP